MNRVIEPLSEVFLYGSPERISPSSFRWVDTAKRAEGKKEQRRSPHVPHKHR